MPPTRTLIKASHIIAYDGKRHRHLKDGVVVIEGDRIIHVGKTWTGAADVTIDAAGRVVTPGMINTHTHLSESPLDRSLVEDTGKRNFYNSALFDMLPGRSGAEDEEMMQICLDFSFAELLQTGTTTVVEMGPKDLYDYTADTAARYGVRVYVGMGYRSGRWYSDDGKAVKYEWNEAQGIRDMDDGVAWLEKNHGTRGGLVNALLAPRQVDTCSAALLKRTREAANRLKAPVTLHTSQSVVEFQEMIRRNGCTPIEWLRDIGFLGPDVLLGHAIIISGHSWANYAGDDLGIMASTGVSVAHAPWVFVRRGVTMESFYKYMQAGINMTLGTDSAPQNMIESLRYASIFAKLIERQTEIMRASHVFDAATLGGARALGRDDLGRIAPGAKADLLIWEGASHSMAPLRDPIRNIVYNSQASDIRTTIVNGRVVMHDGVVVGAPDMRALAQRMQAAGERMWPAMQKGDWGHRTVDQMSPMSYAEWDGA
ncbi:MAG: amidohydrolase family protein [Chloroflexi bacterium]|nr:amidohydrolase family protein [Chloroflexota bacterium]